MVIDKLLMGNGANTGGCRVFDEKEISKLLCFDHLKENRLNRIIITVYEYVSYRILYCGMRRSVSQFVKVWLGLM